MSSRTRAIAAVALLGVVAAACSTSSAKVGDKPSSSTGGNTPPPAAADAVLTITPDDGGTGVAPGDPVVVKVANGKLTHVSIRGSAGPTVTGKFRAGKRWWRSTQVLHTATDYTVRATAVNADGHIAQATSTFRTLRPRQTVNTTIWEAHNGVYGVGMPIILNFDRPVTRKRAVERALEIRSSKPVTGAWYWDGDQTLYFRTRKYWPQHTKVNFVAHLDGVEVAPGVYGSHTLRQSFSIGQSVIAVASTSAHNVHIYVNNKPYATWPTSTGKPGDETPNGTYLTIEKGNPVEMKGPGYDLMVPFSVRFTWSGDYMHAASWSVGSQGFANVSHGCVNLSPADGETYYNLAVPGDPVTVTDSPRGGAWGNGWTVWFLSWKQLLAGSGTGMAVKVGKTGSSFVDPSELKQHLHYRSPIYGPVDGNSAAG